MRLRMHHRHFKNKRLLGSFRVFHLAYMASRRMLVAPLEDMLDPAARRHTIKSNNQSECSSEQCTRKSCRRNPNVRKAHPLVRQSEWLRARSLIFLAPHLHNVHARRKLSLFRAAAARSAVYWSGCSSATLCGYTSTLLERHFVFLFRI